MTQTMSVKLESNKKGCESIHSGQFMVSHFEEREEETEFVESDEESDNNKKKVVLPTPSTSTSTQCMQLTKYIPAPSQIYEIDSDLSQVFQTLNVTYKQKLTSPKWNPFKGIRLRWKEKIRLNNVIWRCWHMQFIMKKRPLVCQFASPLDVDIHNTPQAIILEGKYWKRKWKVITAEYKKWRRFNVNKALGTSNILDTKSEIDILEWSNNDNLMLSDNMSSDTLFSTISQFPFPDSREIARGAGRADFIQPSLGPLQPNFDDFMDLDLDIFNFTNRLAPVPEEQTDELLKAIEFPIGSMDSSNLQDIMSNTAAATQSGSTSMNVDHQQPCTSNSLLYTATIFAQDMSSLPQSSSQIHGMRQQQQNENMISDMNPFISGGISMSQAQQQQQQSINEQQLMQDQDQDAKDSYKGKFSRGYLRKPHNYDKCQPTAHQTTIYNQMLAQQDPQIYAQQQNYANLQDGMSTNVSHISPIQTTTNNFNATEAAVAIASQSILNLSNNQMQSYANKMLMNFGQQQQQQHQQQQQQQMQQPQMNSMANQMAHDSYKSPQSPSYKSYHNISQQPYKIPSQSGNRFRQQSPPHLSVTGSGGAGVSGQSLSFQQQQANVAAAAIKEMYRSNSLPINASIQMPIQTHNKEIPPDQFVVPKYHIKNKNSRSRSNSINYKQGSLLPALQSAASEPSLNANSALAQLLTNTSSSSLLAGCKSTNSAIHSLPQRANSANQINFTVNQTVPSTEVISFQHQKAPQPSTSSTASCGSGSSFTYTPTLSPDSAFHDNDLSPERCLSVTSKGHPRENQRRAGHIHAEQKRRYNIKNGFDMLHSLIPQLQQNPNAKLSKASMLQKGAEYIKQLRLERAAINEQMEGLRKEIDTLTNSLNHLQNALPANGAPVSRQRTGRVKELYSDYVLLRTMTSWKFWIFGLIFEPLLNSFNSTVSVASMDELYRTTMLWVDNSCSLMEIRPAVSNKLRELSTTTDILSENPTSLQEEVLKAITNAKGRTHENPR